jgi:hypothetical protein
VALNFFLLFIFPDLKSNLLNFVPPPASADASACPWLASLSFALPSVVFEDQDFLYKKKYFYFFKELLQFFRIF